MAPAIWNSCHLIDWGGKGRGTRYEKGVGERDLIILFWKPDLQAGGGGVPTYPNVVLLRRYRKRTSLGEKIPRQPRETKGTGGEIIERETTAYYFCREGTTNAIGFVKNEQENKRPEIKKNKINRIKGEKKDRRFLRGTSIIAHREN